MNINLLTIDSNLAGQTDTSPPKSKLDSNTKETQFAPILENNKLKADTPKKPTADNNNKENTLENEKPSSKFPQQSMQPVDRKIKSENPSKPGDKTKLKEQNAIPAPVKQQNKPNVIQICLSENSTTAELSKEGVPKKIEDKSGHQLTQIIANPRNDKSPSVTGQAVKSAQIKLLHTTEKGQLGIKTTLPVKSMGQNGLKTNKPDTSKSKPTDKIQIETENNTRKVFVSTKTIAETKSTIEKGNTKESAPGDSDNTAENTSKAKPSAVNINPTIVQSKTSEKQPQHSRTEPDKPVLTAETDAKANTSQNIRNLPNPNSKETIQADNNFKENQNTQKINTATVQVTTGQTKDQSNLTSSKSPSQGFEQMLSHNNSQASITEPSASAKNAATTNSMGRSSSSDVSADIGKQILESVQRSISQQETDRQITVRLNPPELGKVLIRFQQQDTEITGLMEVNKAQTRFEIEQALPQIIRNLADCGIQIRRLEVMLSNEHQPGQGALGNQSLQSGTTQQQYSGNPGTTGNDTDIHESNEWLLSNNSYENLSELQGVLNTDGSINLLI